MAEKQVLALSGKSRGVLRLEYERERLVFSLESPAYLRDAELWLLFSDRDWVILDCCKGSCPLPPRRVQAAAAARDGQFRMAGGKADFSAARSACFTRQEKKRLKELEVSAQQRPKPGDILPGQAEQQIFRGEQRKSAGAPSAQQWQRAEDERSAQAAAAQQKVAAQTEQKAMPDAQAASELRQREQGKAQISPEMQQRGQEKTQAGPAQAMQKPRQDGQEKTPDAQKLNQQAKAAQTQWEQQPQRGQEKEQSSPQMQARQGSEQEQKNSPGAHQQGKPSAGFSQNIRPQSMPEAEEIRQENAQVQQERAFSSHNGSKGGAMQTPSAHESGRDSRNFERQQGRQAGTSSNGMGGQQAGQWENLPEYVSAPALEELMRATQPQSSMPGRGQAGMQRPCQNSFSASQAGQPKKTQPASPAAMHLGQNAAEQQEGAPQAGQPSEGQRIAAPSAGNAPGQRAAGRPGQAVPKTADAPSSAQRANSQSESPQSAQQKKQGARSAPGYACIQRREKSVQPFPKIFPSSKWVKVEYPSFPGRGYYLSGEIFQGERCAAKALAVPGRYALNPPAGLKGFETYLEDSNAQGYWLLFCDMQGKAIPISQVFKDLQG